MCYMVITESGLVDFELTQYLQLAFQSATIRTERTKGVTMAKNQAVKTKVVAESDPFGPDFTALAETSFNEAIGDVLERQRRKGQDSPCTVDGRLAVRKPDGRIVFKAEKTNG